MKQQMKNITTAFASFRLRDSVSHRSPYNFVRACAISPVCAPVALNKLTQEYNTLAIELHARHDDSRCVFFHHSSPFRSCGTQTFQCNISIPRCKFNSVYLPSTLVAMLRITAVRQLGHRFVRRFSIICPQVPIGISRIRRGGGSGPGGAQQPTETDQSDSDSSSTRSQTSQVHLGLTATSKTDAS